nr:DUF423 domain-containing protein [Picosynechococcus sp. PCC 7003]
MTRFFLVIAPILAGLAVAAGAFASHGLKTTLDPQALAIWETAAKYQMYQAIALLLVGLFSVQGHYPRVGSMGLELLLSSGLCSFPGAFMP